MKYPFCIKIYTYIYEYIYIYEISCTILLLLILIITSIIVVKFSPHESPARKARCFPRG